MAERKKRGLGRGLGALIPDANSTDRPVDVFFSGSNAEEGKGEAEKEKTSRAARNDPAASMQSSRRRKTKAAASNTTADAPEDKNATGKASGSASTTKKSTTRSTAHGTKTGKTTGSRGTAATSGARKISAATASTKKSSPAKSSASRTTADAKSKDTKTAGSKTTAARATETTPAASQSSGTKSAKSGRSTTTAAQSGAGAESTPARKSPSSASTTDSSTGPATAAETETSSVKTSAPAEEATSSATNVSESKLETASVADAAAVSSEAGSAEVNAERGVVEDQAVGGSAASTVTDGGNRTEKTASSPSDARDQSEDVRETHPGVYTSSAYGDQAETEVPGKAAQADDTTDVVTAAPEASSRGDHDHQTSGRSATDEETGQAQASATSSEDTGDEGSAASTAEKESDEETIDEVESIPNTEFGEIPVDLIDTNPRQPRTVFDEDLLAELVHSIREIGVLQPVVVRKKPSDRSRFELIMGERRLRAAKDAGLSTIPAIIRYVDDTDLLRDALLENLHRAELNPLEEAAAYGQLLEDFGCTQEELSERIGRSRPQISNTLRLLRLPPLVQRRVAAGVISAGHARAILGLRDPEHMEVLAQRIVAEGLSVRASEEAVVLLNRGDSVNVSRATTKVSPEFLAVAERLGDRLDTKVNISVGKRKGKLSVEFANQEDLDRILGLLGIDDQDGI